MSKTYKDRKEYRRPGERRPGRYRPGSRRRRLDITAQGVPNENPDLQRLGRAIIDASLRQAKLESDAAERPNGGGRDE